MHDLYKIEDFEFMDFELTEQESQKEESDEEQEVDKPKNEFGLFDEDELENSESI